MPQHHGAAGGPCLYPGNQAGVGVPMGVHDQTPCRTWGLLLVRVQAPHSTLVQIGPTASLPSGTPLPCTTDPRVPKGRGHFAPSEAWVMFGLWSTGAAVLLTDTGLADPWERWARSILSSVHLPRLSQGTWAGSHVASGTSCLALSRSGLGHPHPSHDSTSVLCGHIITGAPASARPLFWATVPLTASGKLESVSMCRAGAKPAAPSSANTAALSC